MTATLTKPNIPLLREVLAQIDATPKLWDQVAFDSEIVDDDGESCGTAFCIAGWALVLSHEYRYDLSVRQFVATADGPEYGGYVDPDTTAQRLLGINDAIAWATAAGGLGLFSSASNRKDIQEIAEELAVMAGETL